MKNSKNILLLSGVLALIIFAWLIPKSKGEKKTEARVSIEEKVSRVDKDSAQTSKAIVAPVDQSNTKQKKESTSRITARKDTASKRFRIKDIKISEFSRKAHCELESKILSSSPDEPVVVEPPVEFTTARPDTLKAGN